MAHRVDRSRKPYARPIVRSRAPEGAWVHDKAPLDPTSGRNINHPTPVQNGYTKLSISNLHYEINPKDLTAIFGQVGTLVREPLIKYDRSGRSSGVAIISYETADEATRAKQQFDGVLAKGQPMSIQYDTVPPPEFQKKLQRRVSAPSSLLHRIQKPALLDRLSQDDVNIKPTPPSRTGPGPIRTTRGRGGGRPAPRKPKTANDLDNELDAFMKDGSSNDSNRAHAKAATIDQDAEMS